ncbi:uncharacterized protein G2W53_033585 [Senna tora]|uniref:Uncharacterized protein n=1 Tax=Senna tora TaxID=362788 RepID=A0A834T9S7_9FABA|nr:uncharacterized protein G2W53_033585 [Senna tora]
MTTQHWEWEDSTKKASYVPACELQQNGWWHVEARETSDGDGQGRILPEIH